MKLILATTSPYRQEAFKQINLDFISQGSEVEEYFKGRPNNPRELVETLSRLKAEAVAERHNDGIVIGFDSVGAIEGKILEKPKSMEEEFIRLRSVSGKHCEFYTGVHMININNAKELSRVVTTDILMRRLRDVEIKKYLDEDPKFHTYALGYDPLGNYSATFAKSIYGSYNNLTRGIPLEDVIEMLFKIGYKI